MPVTRILLVTATLVATLAVPAAPSAMAQPGECVEITEPHHPPPPAR